MLNAKSLTFALAMTGVVGSLAACGEKNPKQVKTSGTGAAKASEEDAKKDENGTEGTGVTPPGVDPNQALLLANYYVEVKAAGINTCKGGVQLKLNAGMGKGESGAKLLEIPSGSIDCGLFGKIDLSQILGSAAGASTTTPVVTVKDDVIFLSAIGGGVFTQNPAQDPGRPMFPSFIAGDPEHLEHLSLDKPTTVISTSEGNKSASGTISMKMLYFKRLYESPHMKQKRPFPKTIAFETTTKGFEGVNKIANMLFDRMEFRISLKPLAIPYISFKGSVADFMKAKDSLGGGGGGAGASNPLGGLFGGAAGGGAGGGAAGGLMGILFQGLTKILHIEFEAHLVEQQGLNYDNDADSNEEDNGVKVGGKSVED